MIFLYSNKYKSLSKGYECTSIYRYYKNKSTLILLNTHYYNVKKLMKQFLHYMNRFMDLTSIHNVAINHELILLKIQKDIHILVVS